MASAGVIQHGTGVDASAGPPARRADPGRPGLGPARGVSFLVTAALVSLVIIAWSAGHLWIAHKAFADAAVAYAGFEARAARLQPIATLLDTQVNAAVATTSDLWRERYEASSQEAHLAREALLLAARQLPELSGQLSRFAASHRELNRLQAVALALAFDDDAWYAAISVVDGEDYAAAWSAYQSAARALATAAERHLTDEVAATQERFRRYGLSAATLLLLLTAGWIAVLSVVRREQTRRVEAEAALLRTLDSQELAIETRTAELTDANATLRREMTQREQTQDKLRERSRALAAEMVRLNTVLESMEEGLSFVNAEGRLVLHNRRYLEISQLPASRVAPGVSTAELREFVGEGAYVGPRLAESLVLGGQAGPRRREPVREEQVRPDGAVIEMRSQALPDGGFVTVYTDATERRRAEARLRDVVEGVPCGILMADADGIITLSNPRMEALFGYAPAELVGQTVEMLLPEKQRTRHIRSRAAFLREGPGGVREMGRDREISARHKDGTEFVAEVGLSAVDTGEGPQVLCVISDVSERRQLQAQLLHAQKLESIGQLAAGIAHEINTPTQYVGDNVRFMHDAFGDVVSLQQAYARLLEAARAGQATPELVAEVDAAVEAADWAYLAEEVPLAIGQAEEGVRKVANIVRAMKEFAHPGSAEKDPVNLNRVVENTLTVARNEYKYVADLETDLAPDLPEVPCLADEVGQVVLNLVVNAAHAIGDRLGDGSGGKGRIDVSTAVSGRFAEIRIADDGGGIPEAARARVFEPFFTTKAVGRGSGQGLAIARNVVVEKHAGELDFETETGRGTTFFVRLPLLVDRTDTEAA